MMFWCLITYGLGELVSNIKKENKWQVAVFMQRDPETSLSPGQGLVDLESVLDDTWDYRNKGRNLGLLPNASDIR